MFGQITGVIKKQHVVKNFYIFVSLFSLYPISFYLIRREVLITCTVCTIRQIHRRHLKCLNDFKSTLVQRHAGATYIFYTEIQLLGCVNIFCLLLHVTCHNKLSISSSKLKKKTVLGVCYFLCGNLQRIQKFGLCSV